MDLIVDYINVGTTKFETEVPATYSTGTWTGANCNPGNPSSQTLHCSGYFQYSIGTAGQLVAATPAGATVTINARGTSGAEIMNLKIKDVIVKTWTVTSAFVNYTYTSTTAIGDKDIKVEFANNGMSGTIDMDLIVDYINVGTTKFETEVPATYSTGTWTGANCNPGNPSSQTLHCSGYFQYSIGTAGGGTATTTPPVTTTPPPTTTTASCGTSPQKTITAPAGGLNTTVAADAPGTCYFLKNGNGTNYTFHDVKPKDNMKFIGESKTGVVVNGNGYENAFHGNTKNVTISNFTLSGFNGQKDCNGTVQKPQEQAPIRGTTCLWQTEPANLATGWVIEDMIINNNVASGVFAGNDFTIRRNKFFNNGITAIGGTRFYGGLFEGNEAYDNGKNSLTGAEQNGGNIKITQVNGTSKQVVIRGNTIYRAAIGIWCDVGCDGVLVEGNTVSNHTSSGMICEVSKNMTFRGNTLNNTSPWVNWTGPFNGGSIVAGECSNILIENNTINGGESAVTVRQTKRPHDAFETGYFPKIPSINLVTSNVTVRNNKINGSRTIGASHDVSKAAGIMNYGSISFSGNTYSNPSGMQFWWNASPQTYGQWQGSGRQ